MNRSRSRLLVIVITVLAALGVMAPASAGTSPYCGITWGSLPKEAGAFTEGPITDLRAGRHACFDRLVVDLGYPAGTGVGYRVQYVPRVVQDGSGAVIPLRGAADLEVVVLAPGHDRNGNPTYRPANRNEAVNVSGFTTFRQVAWGGTFEGQSLVGLGVRAQLPFRVFTLAGTPGSGDTARIAIDVAHRW